MSYVANHYVKVNGIRYARGECLPDNLPDETVEWLVKAGAIQEIALAFSNESDSAQIEEPVEDPEAPEIDVMDGIVDDSQEKPEKRKRNQRGGRSK